MELNWQLSNLNSIKSYAYNGYKVFSCFHCGGGSSMGYKLAGFNVLGGVEIDPAMVKLYKLNLKPQYSYMMGISQFNQIPDKELPQELFNLDILDGSPPCSSFSIAGSREKRWGQKTLFREGQKKQILDDLFFHFIDTVDKLKPKIVVAENVKGLILGKARGYVKQIFQKFKDIGYHVQLFLLNSASMGVPQRRERVFFIARRDNLKLSPLLLNFNEKPISTARAFQGIKAEIGICQLTKNTKQLWQQIKPGEKLSKVHPNSSRFNEIKLDPNKPAPTLTTHCIPMHWNEPRRISIEEVMRLQTFPDDYDFADRKGFYTVGMSVPPYMMHRIATQIKSQWFDNLD